MSGNAEGEVPSAGNLREDGGSAATASPTCSRMAFTVRAGTSTTEAAAIMSLSVMSRPLPLTMQVCSPPTPREGVRS